MYHPDIFDFMAPKYKYNFNTEMLELINFNRDLGMDLASSQLPEYLSNNLVTTHNSLALWLWVVHIYASHIILRKFTI